MSYNIIFIDNNNLLLENEVARFRELLNERAGVGNSAVAEVGRLKKAGTDRSPLRGNFFSSAFDFSVQNDGPEGCVHVYGYQFCLGSAAGAFEAAQRVVRDGVPENTLFVIDHTLDIRSVLFDTGRAMRDAFKAAGHPALLTDYVEPANADPDEFILRGLKPNLDELDPELWTDTPNDYFGRHAPAFSCGPLEEYVRSLCTDERMERRYFGNVLLALFNRFGVPGKEEAQ